MNKKVTPTNLPQFGNKELISSLYVLSNTVSKEECALKLINLLINQFVNQSYTFELGLIQFNQI